MTVPSGPERNDTLVTTDGIVLHRREWPALSPRAVVVLVHGSAGSTVDAAVVRPKNGGVTSGGSQVVSYDSRGHGRSGGVCTMGYRETRDMAAVVEFSPKHYRASDGLGKARDGSSRSLALCRERP